MNGWNGWDRWDGWDGRMGLEQLRRERKEEKRREKNKGKERKGKGVLSTRDVNEWNGEQERMESSRDGMGRGEYSSRTRRDRKEGRAGSRQTCVLPTRGNSIHLRKVPGSTMLFYLV